jgi:hypothetical protein
MAHDEVDIAVIHGDVVHQQGMGLPDSVIHKGIPILAGQALAAPRARSRP